MDLEIYPMFASHPFIRQIYSECLPCVRHHFICWEYGSKNASPCSWGKPCKETISRGYKPQQRQKSRGEKVNQCPMGFGTLSCGPARDRTALHLLHLIRSDVSLPVRGLTDTGGRYHILQVCGEGLTK